MDISDTQIPISNIIALVATLPAIPVAGTACGWFGLRYTFAGCLLIGAIPLFLSSTAHNVQELCALRFFIGILGGSFVPCQVWATGCFDKNVVGRANSLTAGFGKAGGVVTYFVMPAIYRSIPMDGLSPHIAWRVAFVVPGIMIVSVATAVVVLHSNTATGESSQRLQAAESNLRSHSVDGTIVDVPRLKSGERDSSGKSKGRDSPPEGVNDEERKLDDICGTFSDHESQLGEQEMLVQARGKVIQKPSFKEIMRVCASPQTLVLGACYFCTFGSELNVNSVLEMHYAPNFHPWACRALEPLQPYPAFSTQCLDPLEVSSPTTRSNTQNLYDARSS